MSATSRCGGPGVVRFVEAYGDAPRQHGEWWLPADVEGALPTVVLVHGGYWRPRYDRSLQDAVAADLSARGFLCWNVEYAAADAPWPATVRDVAAAHDALLTGTLAGRVDPIRTALVGHSAGGHLALWLASRHRLPVDAPGARGADPAGRGPGGAEVAPRPAVTVAQAPVACLARGARERLGSGAVLDLLGGTPQQVADRYAVADPEALLPTGGRTVLLHAPLDDVVPISQSREYAQAARLAGDDCTLVEVPGGHFEHLDPASAAVAALRAALEPLTR